jgi:hypothetical protein
MTSAPDQRPVLAWCETCKVPFTAGVFGGGGMALGLAGQSLYIGEMISGPEGVQISGTQAACPVCNTMGNVQDGLYDTVFGVIRQGRRILRTLTPTEAAALVEALRRRRRDEVEDDAVVEAAPESARPWLRDLLSKVDKKFWLSIILTLLIAIQAERGQRDSEHAVEAVGRKSDAALVHEVDQLSNTDHQLERLVREMTERLHNQPAPPSQRKAPASTTPTPSTIVRQPARPGRNDQCFCGSGRKFKHCHLDSTRNAGGH